MTLVVAKTLPKSPHPVIWAILYVPFGALGGFISVALTYLATQHGLSISEGAMLNGASLLTQWLKWIWAPAIDVTLTPKRWYVMSTALSAVGVFAMAAMPMSPATLGILLAIIAIASLVNSVVGMAIETMMATLTPKDQIGRVSGWFQAGNLGGAGIGGGLGLLLMETLPAPWMAGFGMALLFMSCCFALFAVPFVPSHVKTETVGKSVANVAKDLVKMVKTRGGLLSAFLCFLPVGTGAAQSTLAQAAVAKTWQAGALEVERVQGLMAGLVTAIGCFAGGWICHRVAPRTAYASFGFALALIAVGMGLSPKTVTMYVAWNFIYAFAVGLCYAGFTAIVLESMGKGSGATKYNTFASLSNFPLWWLGLALGKIADRPGGASKMLFAEAAFGVVGVALFTIATQAIKRTKLPELVLEEAEIVPLDAASDGPPKDAAP
jgi:hypothetical protein